MLHQQKNMPDFTPVSYSKKRSEETFAVTINIYSFLRAMVRQCGDMMSVSFLGTRWATDAVVVYFYTRIK